MESVVKAVGLPISLAGDVNDDLEEKREEKTTTMSDTKSRKRRYSSGEEYRRER